LRLIFLPVIPFILADDYRALPNKPEEGFFFTTRLEGLEAYKTGNMI